MLVLLEVLLGTSVGVYEMCLMGIDRDLGQDKLVIILSAVIICEERRVRTLEDSTVKGPCFRDYHSDFYLLSRNVGSFIY